MPTIKQNQSVWNAYNWDDAGEIWSSAWGGASMQWYGTILPRIYAFLHGPTILEIAPGFGRWTRFLKDYCNNLIVVDLSEKCIKACQERFAGCSHITYFVNNGKSLDMVPDGTIDFAFSFDSLVHAEDDVISAYVSQLSRKLKYDGAAFIHHSNLGQYSNYYNIYSTVKRIPKVHDLLTKWGIFHDDQWQWHACSMSAKKMRLYAEKNGLTCISQELITWNTRCFLIDCLSTIVKKESLGSRNNKIFVNATFMKEAKYLSKISQLYDPLQ